MSHARLLRARALRDAMSAFLSWPRRKLLSLRSPERPVSPHRVISALTAIRSSAEILRDYPDMAQDERRRFADTVIREGDRLEAMVSRLLTDRDHGRGRPAA